MDIRVMREIVEERQCREVDGVLVDMQTANVIVTVYGSLSRERKATMDALPIQAAARIAWKAVGK